MENTDFIDGTGLATALVGDSIATNLFMLGYAFQKGMIPLGLDAIERAIELNGVAAEANKRTLSWGRLAAHDPAAIDVTVAGKDEQVKPRSFEQIVARHVELLAQYQNAAYARRYADLVSAVQAAEKANGKGMTGLAEAVALNLYRLMAYKDEYEVARLYVDGTFLNRLRKQFEGDFRLHFHLAPPLFAARDPATGQLKKRRYGPWMFQAFRLLASLKRVRGTRFDLFGYTAERKMERQLIVQYEAALSEIAARLSPENYAIAVELARQPESIRGFGHVKEKSIEVAQERHAKLVESFRQPLQAMAAAE